jgi:hypothetical protein
MMPEAFPFAERHGVAPGKVNMRDEDVTELDERRPLDREKAFSGSP